MKLSTKILTALLPAAALGTIVPTTVSCSCGGNSYVINYGDDVNCKDEKAENYHSLDDVKNAVKARALKEPAGEITQSALDHIEIIDENDDIFNVKNIQEFYYDLIASYVTRDVKVVLKNWKADNEKKTLSFTFNNKDFNDVKSIYYDYLDIAKVGKGIQIVVETEAVATVLGISYRFSDCTFKPS